MENINTDKLSNKNVNTDKLLNEIVNTDKLPKEAKGIFSRRCGK